MRNITPEQETDIANRLGLTEPKCPKEVAEYMADLEKFESVKQQVRTDQLSSWDNAEKALIHLNETRAELDRVEQAIEKLNSHSELVKLAYTTYGEQVSAYNQAIRAEAEKPRKAFQDQQSALVASLAKESRSLNYRISRLDTKRWNSEDTQEKEAIVLEQDSLKARLSVVDYLKDQITYLSYSPELPELTEQLIWEHLEQNTWLVSGFIENLSKVVDKQTA